MKSYFADKINPKARAQYVAGNINEAEVVFSLSEAELEEIAGLVIETVDLFFAESLEESLEEEKNYGNNDGNNERYLLQLYLRDIRRYPEIDFTETVTLARAIELNNSVSEKAREYLICTYLGWAYKIAGIFAKKYSFLYFDLLDLVQAANLGLVDAVDKWEKSKTKGATFASYAAHRVTGEILDYLRNNGNPGLKVPRQIQELKPKIDWLLEHWSGDTAPSVDAIAKLCGVPRKTAALALFGEVVFLDEPIDEEVDKDGEEEEKEPLSFFIPDRKIPPDREATLYLEAKNYLKSIKEAIESFVQVNPPGLKKRNREILCVQMGLDDLDETMSETSEYFGITGSRVCQLVSTFFAFLKAKTGIQGVRKQEIRAMREFVAAYEDKN